MKRTCLSIRSIFFAFGLAISSWAPMIPFTKDRLELDDAGLGLILLVLGLGALVMMPITGWLIQRLGSKIITTISALAVLGLLPCLAIVSTVPMMTAMLFLFGIATGAMNVSMNAQAVDIEIVCKEPILSGVHCWFSIGGLLGAGVVSLLLGFGFSLFLSAAAISLIVLFLVIINGKHLLSFEQQPKTATISQGKFLFPNSQVLFLGCLCFIAFMAEGAMLDWSAEYLTSDLEYQPSLAGIGYSFFSIAMALGRSIGDRVIQRLGSTRVFQLGCLIAASGFLTVVNLSWGYLELLGFGLIGIGASNVVPILFSSSGKIPHIPSNYALTVVTTCGYVGLLIGPAIIGFVAEAISLSFAFVSLSFALMIIGFLGLLIIAIPVKNVEDS